jgi:hypothetical protein
VLHPLRFIRGEWQWEGLSMVLDHPIDILSNRYICLRL